MAVEVPETGLAAGFMEPSQYQNFKQKESFMSTKARSVLLGGHEGYGECRFETQVLHSYPLRSPKVMSPQTLSDPGFQS